MRRSVILLTLAVLVLAGGCERKEASDEPQAYDPSLDAPPSPIVANPDPLLLANQSEIAKNAPKRSSAMPGPARQAAAVAPAPQVSATPPPAQAGPTPAVAAGATEVSPQTVEAIKKTILAIADASVAKQYDKLADFFVPDDAAALKPLLDIAPAMRDKARKLVQLIRQKLGPQLPPGLDQFVQTTEAELKQSEKFNRTVVENGFNKVQFALQPDGKVAISNGTEEITFVHMNNTWKIELSQEKRSAIPQVSELVRAVDRFYDSLIGGLQNGTITKDNALAQFRDRANTLLMPTMKKIQASPAMAKLQRGGGFLFSSFFEGSGSAEGEAAPASAGPASAAAANRPQAKAEDAEAVKKVLLTYIDTCEAKQYSQLIDCFVSTDAGVLRSLTSAVTAHDKAARNVVQVIRQKFGTQLPQDVAQFVASTEAGLAQGNKFTHANPKEEVNKLHFTSQDGKVIASDDAAAEVAFVNVNGAWKIELDPKIRPLLKATTDVIKASSKLCDAMTSGIENGTITPDNFSAQYQEQTTTFLGPLQAKLGAMGTLQEKSKTSFLCDLTLGVPADFQAGQPAATATGGTGTAATATGAPSAAPTTPAASPPTAGPAPASGGDINSGRGPEKAEEMKRSLLAPARRVYGGGS